MFRIILHSIVFSGFLLIFVNLSEHEAHNGTSDYVAAQKYHELQSYKPKSYKPLTYNRYQAIYFCKQNRWAFCQSWGELSVTRLA